MRINERIAVWRSSWLLDILVGILGNTQTKVWRICRPMLGCKELKSFHTNGRSNALLLPIIPVSMHILLLIVVTFSIIAIIIVVCVVIGFVVVIIIIIILISIFLLYRRLVYLSRSLSAKKWWKGQAAKRIHDWNPVCTVQVPHVGVWNRYS